ncbi:MAG: hypothetical protein AAB658_03285, partial [Chloroflexota bacterium]
MQLGTNHMGGWQWTPNGEVTLYINGTEAATVQTDEWGNFSIHFGELDPFVSGMDFVVTDGLNTKTMTTAYLEITNVDPEADTVSGLAPIGQQFDIWVHGENAPGIQVTADSLGQWTADFSGQWDIVPGTDGAAQINDEDGDGTWVPWRVPNPTFGIWPWEDHINGWDFLPLTTIQVSVDDPGTPGHPDYQTSTTTDQWGNFHAEVGQVIDLRPGILVTVSDGATTKEHIVTNIVVTRADADSDTVAGTAAPGSPIHVWYCWENGCVNRDETADVNGNWAANFGVPGDQDWEQTTFDLQPGISHDANQPDEDGDVTQIHWHIYSPWLEIWYPEDRVQVAGWPLDTVATLTIDDDFDPSNGVLFENAYDRGGQDRIYIELSGIFDLQPGHVVTVSDAQYTLYHQITNLVVTGFDLELDLIFGSADPNTSVNAHFINPGTDWVWRSTTAGENGLWVMDFSQPGPNPGEETLLDIKPGTGGAATQ